jgi:type II secretory pathway pseudopilin PulG
LVELVIVMAVIGLILAAVIPNLRATQQEGQLTKTESELQTLKTAVVSYWRGNTNLYPDNITTTLASASPAVISAALPDPFETTSATESPTGFTYGYKHGLSSVFGPWFAIYSKGPKGDTVDARVTWEEVSGAGFIQYCGTGRVVSNAPVKRTGPCP